ncbi:MAG: sulfite exporter TauE/SafE family protein [Candidatus Eremiobacteraeota bacterium]|nr:sulfite exporter TauE/SafE family protein [Candidatus Eremiobacteraeota bacterium]MBV8366953.1 sulfite exporter TauE/SafE family protein [Candidatus Eremiobacteraeota bacterium]
MYPVLAMWDFHATIGGLIVGLLVGLSGVGGGSLMMPILVLLLGVSPLIAVGTDLAYSVPTKLVGAIVHKRQGTIHAKLVGVLCAGGIPGALLGLGTLAFVKAHVDIDQLNALLRHIIGVLLIIIAIAIVAAQIISTHRPAETVSIRAKAPLIIAIGAIVGFLVSITSIGAGSITLTALALVLPRLRLQQLVGSDVAFAAIIVPIAAAGHMTLGSINWPLTLSLLLGSVPGVYAGSRLCAILPLPYLRPVIAAVLAFAGVKLF